MKGSTPSAVLIAALAIVVLSGVPSSSVHADDIGLQQKAERKQGRAAERQETRDQSRAPISPGQDFKLIESPRTSGATNRKPSETVGIFYYIHGRRRIPTGDNLGHPQPYFLQTLQANGWDVVVTKIPSAYDGHTWGQELVPGAVRFLKQRASELKAQGYPRVVIAGFAWGAWVTATAAQGEFAADTLVLINPTLYGPKDHHDDGRLNNKFQKNLTELQPLLRGIRKPTVLLTSADNRYIADGIGAYAAEQFDKNKVPSLLIDKPPGFTGQYAEYLPVYDFLYGDCIAAFLKLRDSVTCERPTLANDDYRSIVTIGQVAEVDKRRITSAKILSGRSFNVYPLGDLLRNYNFEPTGQRLHDSAHREIFHGQPLRPKTEDYSFRDGQYCVGTRCSSLLSWSATQFLEFDNESGKLKAWWVER